MMTVDGTEIGLCLYGTEISMKDYSRKERDTFGNITIIERGYSDVVNYSVDILTANAHTIRNLLASKRAVSAVYIGASGAEVTAVTGYLNDFTIQLSDWQYSRLTLEVEGEVHGTP